VLGLLARELESIMRQSMTLLQRGVIQRLRDRDVPGPVRVISRAIIDHPVVGRALARAAAGMCGDRK
jgi:hypothetical protein